MHLLRITHVDVQGTASRAGLAVGDHIESVDREVVTSVDHLRDLVMPNLRNMRTRSCDVAYFRKGERFVANVARGDPGVQAVIEAYDRCSANRERLLSEGVFPATTIAAHLEPFLFSSVVVNLEDPLKSVECVLAGVGSDHILLAKGKSVTMIPNAAILLAKQPSSTALLQIVIRHQVIYKGSIGVGLSIPL